jgi:hypothetical protein
MRSKLLLALLLIGLISFANVYAHDDDEGTVLTYKILDAPEYVEWWPLSGDSAFNVTFTADELEVHINNLEDSESEMTIKIGDQEIETTDIEADASLALGYWNISLSSGFIANTDWVELENELEVNTFISIYNLTRNVVSHTFTINHVESTVSAISYSFEDGFQTTTLTYSLEEGVLLYAKTSFGNYLLEIELVDVHGDALVTVVEPAETNAIGLFTLFGVLTIIIKIRTIFCRKN